MSDWRTYPTWNGRKWLEQTLREHSRVSGLEAINEHVYVVTRKNLPAVRLWLCDPYTLGVADYRSIREADPDVNAIVVLSMWNHYSPQAKEQGKAEGVGVFKPVELFRALHRKGDEFACG